MLQPVVNNSPSCLPSINNNRPITTRSTCTHQSSFCQWIGHHTSQRTSSSSQQQQPQQVPLAPAGVVTAAALAKGLLSFRVFPSAVVVLQARRCARGCLVLLVRKRSRLTGRRLLRGVQLCCSLCNPRWSRRACFCSGAGTVRTVHTVRFVLCWGRCVLVLHSNVSHEWLCHWPIRVLLHPEH
jgi:hypothetical protein